MPTNKDFKRLVRARMQKTGEAYTTARAHILQKKPSTRPVPPAPAEYAKLAGKTDAVVKANTGCTWERWVKALDRVGAQAWPHGRIARYVQEKYSVSGWWSQTVTVGYERIKGLRAVGQRLDGTFEANKSKTFGVPLPRLYRAWTDPRTRARWLPGASIRSATPEKYLRIILPDATSALVGFIRKDDAKTSVYVQHGKLADRAAADQMKTFWEEKLGALGEILSQPARLSRRSSAAPRRSLRSPSRMGSTTKK